MADGIAIASFDSVTGTTPFDQTVTVSPSFPIKALIFWSNAATAEGNAGDETIGFGMATGAANEWTSGLVIQDAQSTTDADKIKSSSRSCILPRNVAGSPDFNMLFELKSLGTGTFTITWLGTDPGNGRKVHYIAIGGSDITAANVTEVTLSTAIGNSNYAHGLGATPTIVFFLCNSLTVDNTTTAHAKLSLGVAMSSTKRWAKCLNARDAQTMTALVDAMKQQKTVACVLGLTDTSTADMEIDFVSMDATNVTLNNVDAPAAAYQMAMLSIAGGSWDLGATNKTTTAAPVDQALASGLAFQPNLALMASYCAVAGTAIIADSEFSIGAGTSATKELSLWGSCDDGSVNPTFADTSIKSDKCFQIWNEGAPATLASECDFKQFDAAGFTVTWTTNDTAVSEQICWIAALVTDTPPGGATFAGYYSSPSQGW